MKEKNKLIKRLGAFVCALIVAVSCMGSSMNFYASVSAYYPSGFPKDNLHFEVPEGAYGYKYIACFMYETPTYSGAQIFCSNTPFVLSYSKQTFGYEVKMNYDRLYYATSGSTSWGVLNSSSTTGVCWSSPDGYTLYTLLYSNSPIYDTDGLIYADTFENGLGPVYNSALGYLQNISRKSTYIRDALYNYDEDSLTYHWYHGTITTSGVDLTSGNYAVRHYISMATVTGYDKEDIVKMTDKYLMGEYDASQGYFSYLNKDYDEKMETLGYEQPSWFDKVFLGYFTLAHHYLQIVNLDTNEVGGYVHLYPKDSDSDNFGVELNHEGLDDNFEVDEDAPSGVVDDFTGSGTTTDDALENADEPKLDDLSGVDEFIEVVKAYGQEVGNVSSGIGALLGVFPPWILGVLGLAFVFIIVCIIVNSMKG